MTKIFRCVSLIVTCLILSANLIFSASATSGIAEGILSVSHGGDAAEYEINSEEAVLSAFSKGADFVSVNIRKNADGELILCSENKTEISGIPLGEMLDKLSGDDVIILDFADSLRDEIYSVVESKNAFSKAVLRINDSAGNIVKWLEDKNSNLQVVGVYDSFVVFTAVSHIKTLSKAGMPIVGYSSKNYFNEMFGSFVSKTLKADNMPKAMISTYDPDLCGQRSDSEDGWNDLIKKGYSVIETNNLDAFLRYVQSNKEIRSELENVFEKAKLIEADRYNTVSRENLLDSIELAKVRLGTDKTSNDELQDSVSKLRLAMENLALKTDEDTQKGALNITVGKVIAAVVVGLAILAAQIYTYKMQKRKKK